MVINGNLKYCIVLVLAPPPFLSPIVTPLRAASETKVLFVKYLCPRDVHLELLSTSAVEFQVLLLKFFFPVFSCRKISSLQVLVLKSEEYQQFLCRYSRSEPPPSCFQNFWNRNIKSFPWFYILGHDAVSKHSTISSIYVCCSTKRQLIKSSSKHCFTCCRNLFTLFSSRKLLQWQFVSGKGDNSRTQLFRTTGYFVPHRVFFVP